MLDDGRRLRVRVGRQRGDPREWMIRTTAEPGTRYAPELPAVVSLLERGEQFGQKDIARARHQVTAVGVPPDGILGPHVVAVAVEAGDRLCHAETLQQFAVIVRRHATARSCIKGVGTSSL